MAHTDVSLVHSAEVCTGNRACGCTTTPSRMLHPLASLSAALLHGEVKEGLSLGDQVPWHLGTKKLWLPAALLLSSPVME